MLKDLPQGQASQRVCIKFLILFFSLVLNKGIINAFWASFDLSDTWVEAGDCVGISTSALVIFVPLCPYEALGGSATHPVFLLLPSTTGKVHFIYQHLRILKSVYLKAIIFSFAFLLFLNIASSKASWSVPLITFTFSSVWDSTVKPSSLFHQLYSPPFSCPMSIGDEGFSFNKNSLKWQLLL